MADRFDIAGQDRLRLRIMEHAYGLWQSEGERQEPGMQALTYEGLADALSAAIEPVKRAVEYLCGVGLMQYVASGPTISIIWGGVREFEESLRSPDEPTPHLAAINILNIGSVVESQIQQGTTASSQHSEFLSGPEVEDIRRLVGDLEAAFRDIVESLSPSDRADAEAQIRTLEAQLASAKPRRGVLRGCVSALQGVAVGAAGTTFGELIVELLKRL